MKKVIVIAFTMALLIVSMILDWHVVATGAAILWFISVINFLIEE